MVNKDSKSTSPKSLTSVNQNTQSFGVYVPEFNVVITLSPAQFHKGNHRLI